MMKISPFALAAFLPFIFTATSANNDNSIPATDSKEDDVSLPAPMTQSPTSSGNIRGRKLWRSCTFDGKLRVPGQWLEGPALTCMCDRNGSGRWTDCVDNSERAIAGGGNPNTAFGRRQQFQPSDFKFDILGSVPEAITNAGTVQPLGVAQLPALAGEGVAYSLFQIEPCGINLPHTHPRATELLYVIEGENLRTAFTEENGEGSRVIVNDISKGEATFFPRGLIHYQQNLSCQSATYISALNSEDPGVITVTTHFFDLPTEALEGSLGTSNEKVDQLIAGLPRGPAEGRRECLAQCGW